MSLDLASLYIPELEDLPAGEIAAMRAAVAAKITTNDVDTSPNTPFGDLMVSPGAVDKAFTQEIWRRFFSDMDLRNTEEGVTYNCEFLRSYLDQLGIYDSGGTRKSYGLVRLSFEDSSTRTLDRSTVFSSGSVELRPELPLDGGLQILNPGAEAPAGNYVRLIARGETGWVADILVSGPSGSALAAASSFSLDREIPGLASATLLSGYQTGSAPSELIDLARRARFNTHSLSPNTRGGVLSAVNQMLPDVRTVGCTVSGDVEMARDGVNPGSVASGCMDVLVRGDLLVTETISVRVNYIPVSGGSVFFGELKLPQNPILFRSLTGGGQTMQPTYISVSSDPSTFPGLSAAYGDRERVFVEFPMPDTPLPLSVDETGDDPVEYAMFELAYSYDPLVRMVAGLMAGDNAPVGLRTYVRYFLPVVVETLNITYNRKAGRAVDLPTARAELMEVLNRHTYHSPAGAPNIADSMHYAGAHSVSGIDLVSTVRFSCADRVFLGTTSPGEILSEAAHTTFTGETSVIEHGSVEDMYTPGFLASAGEGMFGQSGPRNVTWLLESPNLIFTENRTLG